MVLQAAQLLSMVGLGIENDVPPDLLQPPLPDGIHLRWQFGEDRAFPWYGYYLYRRPHDDDQRLCVRGRFRSLATNFLGAPFNGALGSLQHTVPEGTFLSDKPLIVTDDFPPANFAELDLRDRNQLSYLFAEPARQVISEIGFRAENNGFTCIRFTQSDPPVASAPRVVNGAFITTQDFDGSDRPTSELTASGQAIVLNLRAGARIELPCLANRVTIALISGNRAGGAEARDENGNTVARSPIPEPRNGISVIDLQGEGIAQISLDLPQNETFLLAMCWRCTDTDASANPQDVEIRYFAGATLIHTETVSGAPGSTVTASFNADLITSVQYAGADAALVDVCYTPIREALRPGWQIVPGLAQPIALPVREPDYPASGNLPTNVVASEAVALQRITYGDSNDWQGARFAELHAAMRDLVNQGPAGPSMTAVGDDDVVGIPSEPKDVEDPKLKRMRPLNYLMIGALYPQISQMLGLYWADQSVVPGRRYDYMVVADHTNAGMGNAATMLNFLLAPATDFNRVDVWISFDLQQQAQPPLTQPSGLRVYALPGSTKESPSGLLGESENNAGLVWQLPEIAPGIAAPEAPVLHWIRRAALGSTEPTRAIPPEAHLPVSDSPHAVTEPNLPAGVAAAERSPDWPPLSLHYIDSGLSEGWYSYRINAIDLFGRWSPPSAPAQWWQWTPAPTPVPWYFDPDLGDAVVNLNGVSLLDKTAPPPPAAVEAFALDPQDPYLERDSRFQTWFATLSAEEQGTTLGLRVRWLWSFAQMRQAPDTAEFRVYLNPGLDNNFKGRITSVTAVGADISQVTTTIANTHGVNAWNGAILRSGSRSFTVSGSQAGTPLVLEVANLGTANNSAPVAGLRCNVALLGGTQSSHPLATDFSRPTAWADRIWVVGIDDYMAEGVIPSQSASGETLAGADTTVTGNVATLPPGTDISGVQVLNTHLFLADDTARPSRLYRIMSLDAPARQLVLDGVPALLGAAASDWEVGVRVRRYELFLPAPGDGDRSGLTLTPSRTEPVAYAQVGVTAVDDKSHTGDMAKWAGQRWGDRTGNEGAIGGPATVYRVYRTPPGPPRVPEDAEAVFASPPDYQRKSYYTVRWETDPELYTHVFRALDQSVFARDWAIRQTRGNLSPVSHAQYFPPGWSSSQQNTVAAALNAIATQADYSGLGADARNLLGRLPGNEGFASQGNLDARDWLIRQTRSTLSASDAAFFPDDWTDALVRQAAADDVNGISSRDDYAELTNNGLRVLAALPGNEAAFQQITDLPLLNVGPATQNRAGPDNPPGFPIDPTLRAYVDGLDGRARNRYFYRTAFIDEAQNLGPMGLSSPPVYLRNVAPPRRPVFVRALAGEPDTGVAQDRKITLAWASNREADLASYRLYRTADPTRVRKTRLMDLVSEIAVPSGSPAARPAEVVFTDAELPGLVTFTYRLEAVDTAGNRSLPSEPIAARAFDTTLPEVPEVTLGWVELAGNTRAELSWTTEHEVMVQRREAGSPWIDLAQWRSPGTVTVRDPFSNPAQAYTYRLLVRKYTGARARGEPMELEPQDA